MSAFIRLGNLFQLYSWNPIINGGSRELEASYTNAVPPGAVLNYTHPSQPHLDGAYKYLSFIYQGAAKNRTGDNLQASLILSTNQISQGIAREAVEKHWHLQILTVIMNADHSVNKVLTDETWLVSTMTYDPEKLEVILSSGIDAVGANAPTTVLTRDRVGSLPVTANISSR